MTTNLAPAARTGWTAANRAREQQLLALLASLPDDSAAHSAARDELIQMHLPLVEHIASRFRHRGEPYTDLVQVGTVGLINAVDRFDPKRGTAFSTFATPTIAGEIKRHFRDRGWAIRVPRRLQEMRMRISAATDLLSQQTGRSPTTRELAEYLDVDEDDVLDGLESAQAYSTVSLDMPVGGADESGSVVIGDEIGDDDAELELVENRETLRVLLAQLPARDRQIIVLRFFRNRTQSQIAAELGISQMHVSRLLSRSLEQLRAGLRAED